MNANDNFIQERAIRALLCEALRSGKHAELRYAKGSWLDPRARRCFAYVVWFVLDENNLKHLGSRSAIGLSIGNYSQMVCLSDQGASFSKQADFLERMSYGNGDDTEMFQSLKKPGVDWLTLSYGEKADLAFYHHKEHGLSQYGVARVYGISQATVCRALWKSNRLWPVTRVHLNVTKQRSKSRNKKDPEFFKAKQWARKKLAFEASCNRS